MASRPTWVIKSLGTNRIAVFGRIIPQGSVANGTVLAVDGLGLATAVQTSTGIHTLSFTDKYNSLLYCDACVQEATNGDFTAIPGIYTANLGSAAASTLVIATRRIGTLDYVPAGANNFINVFCIFKNTSLTP